MRTSRTDARPGGTAAWISLWGARRPDHPCVIFEDTPTSWGAFDRSVSALAARLWELGVRQGDRVGCLLPNRPEYLIAFWATLRLGAMFVPYNVRLVAAELAVVIDDSEPLVVVSDASFAQIQLDVDGRRRTQWFDIDTVAPVLSTGPAAEAQFEIPWLSEDDPAAIVYTSGTTGRSKGAVLTHGNLVHNSLAWTAGFGLTGDDRLISLLSLCYVGGLLNTTLNASQTGATIVLEPRFDAESALRRIERYKVTWFNATPQIVQRLFTHPLATEYDLSSVGFIETGGAPVPLALAELTERFGIDLVQGFGITEASGGINLFLPREDVIRKVGSIGKPGPCDEVRLVDDSGKEAGTGEVGEMLLRGPLVMRGYWRNEAATRDALTDGWLHTGDLARMDDEGYVTLVGRKKEMIISGGLNVYPVEVEQVLEAFPEIAQAAVVGLPDQEWGERVSAFVILESGMALTEEEVIARCRSQLAGYRLPRIVKFVEDFPRTASGKVRKADLVSQWLAAPR
jgi:fatty-acyl-CoA synthase